jgi:RTX calcium-binding nonapeptide repeat (4 copies)
VFSRQLITRYHLLLAVLPMLLAVPATAAAGQMSGRTEVVTDEDQDHYTVTAGAGESNSIEIQKGVVVRDTTALLGPFNPEPDPDIGLLCKALDPHAVKCEQRSEFRLFTVLLGDGNDRLTTRDSEPIVADGGPGDDALTGGPSGDKLNGGAGRDLIQGGAGRDYLFGGPGGDSDVIAGGAGIDEFVAEYEATVDLARGRSTGAGQTDTLAGVEQVIATTGATRITGSAGTDYLGSLTPRAVLSGGRGSDLLYGRATRYDGGPGDDEIYPFTNRRGTSDAVYTSRGRIDCGPGDDTIGVMGAGQLRAIPRRCEWVAWDDFVGEHWMTDPTDFDPSVDWYMKVRPTVRSGRATFQASCLGDACSGGWLVRLLRSNGKRIPGGTELDAVDRGTDRTASFRIPPGVRTGRIDIKNKYFPAQHISFPVRLR